MKKLLEISSFYTYLLKMTVIWCTAPEIWSATEFLSFWGPFFLIWNILLHMSTINEGHMIHGSWNIMCNTEFFVILGHFCSFIPWLPRKSKFWKIDLCTINDNHMIYAFSFFVIFCSFIHLTTQKIIWCMVREIWSRINRFFFFFHFWLFFALLPH